jgi:hypothetical protein
MVKSLWVSMVRIVRQLVGKPESWLSDSGRGPIEQTGKCINVTTSVRGLSIKLDNGKVVCWKVNRYAAESILRMLTAGESVVIDQATGMFRSDDGTVLLNVIEESECFRITNVNAGWLIQLKENCSINHTTE